MLLSSNRVILDFSVDKKMGDVFQQLRKGDLALLEGSLDAPLACCKNIMVLKTGRPSKKLNVVDQNRLAQAFRQAFDDVEGELPKSAIRQEQDEEQLSRYFNFR